MKIKKIEKIKKTNLDQAKYFESLLMQAYINDLLSDFEAERIQIELIDILKIQTEKFSSGDSSSIRIEKAQDILNSIMFTIGIWLKRYDNPDDAVELIKKEKLYDIYIKGRHKIDSKINITKLLHLTLIKKLINTQNYYHNATIIDGINGFFKLYYPDFLAQEIHITADYPVFNTMEKLLGIEFIQSYLENLYYENAFCSNFSTEDIHYLLSGYHEEYKELVINIYELILTTCIGCIIVNEDAKRLKLSLKSIETLNVLFSDKSTEEIYYMLLQAVKILDKIFILDNNLVLYIKESLEKIATNIINSVETNTIAKVFIISKYPEENKKLNFSFGNRMDNELYRKIIIAIKDCKDLNGKLNIITNRVNSLADLEDILLDGNFTCNEVKSILKLLNPTEFIALYKRYYDLQESSLLHIREGEIILSECICDLFNSFTNEQKITIKKTARKINL
ncbi:DUF6179 domain-containing protein [Clostridiaceae bacterium M8S5]|nr:DUF6179 domain-containing protein [Clostridiaceae bacterium M8S5]